MIAPGDIVVRSDADQELYVVVVSGALHLAAGTGRVITCPFVPGDLPGDAMSLVVSVVRPAGVVLPELVQWLPVSALGERIGVAEPVALAETVRTVAALMS